MPEGYSSSSIMLLFKAGLSGCCYGPLVVVVAQTIKVRVCVISLGCIFGYCGCWNANRFFSLPQSPCQARVTVATAV